tara:strand:- start:527 stop:832 length:306 start_codon:yes stop_codon:yes gene_type:complete
MYDRLIGEEIKSLRTSLGISQKKLASLMREQGFQWAQATVYKIEKAQRDLTWNEGVALGRLIGFGGRPNVELETVRDATAYRRILTVIGETEAQRIAEARS